MKLTATSMVEQNDMPFLHKNKGEIKMASDDVAEIKIQNTDSLVHIRLPFVHKLYLMLNDMEAKGNSDIISWIGDGKAFKIHNPSLFETSIQPQYFRQSRLASFIRQCYGYGFAKIEDKSNMNFGAYVHPDFERDSPTRACTIQRRGTVGSDRRLKTTPTSANDHPIRHCGAHVISDLHESFSSLGTWQSSGGEMKPEVRLNSDWNNNTIGPTIISVHAADSLLPRHVSTLDDWLADLQVAFASSPPIVNTASRSKGMLSFAEFKSLFEPRPIEFMINR